MASRLNSIGGLSLGVKDVWVEMDCKDAEHTWDLVGLQKEE